MDKLNNRNGLSLIELVISLAISMAIMGSVLVIYSNRKNIAYDDAARRIVSDIKTIKSNAQQYVGPTDSGLSSFSAGDTIYGQAIYFGDTTCKCMKVYKLKKSGGTVSDYDSYVIYNPQNYSFSNFNIVAASTTNYTLVIPNQSYGEMYTTSLVPSPGYSFTDPPASASTITSTSYYSFDAGGVVKYNVKIDPFSITQKRN